MTLVSAHFPSPSIEALSQPRFYNSIISGTFYLIDGVGHLLVEKKAQSLCRPGGCGVASSQSLRKEWSVEI